MEDSYSEPTTLSANFTSSGIHRSDKQFHVHDSFSAESYSNAICVLFS